MRSETERFSTFTRRGALLAGAQGLLSIALAGRMYYLGVVQSDQYKTLADENRFSLRLLAPERGEILDRAGRRLATNRHDYRVFLIPEQSADMVDTLNRLGRIIEISEGTRNRIFKQIKRQRGYLPVTVASNLSWDDFARINVESPNLPGIQPDVGPTRLYPHGAHLAPVTGYVGAVSEEERQRDNPLHSLPGFKIGKSEIEKSVDDYLRGTAGSSRVEVNANGRVVREVARQDGLAGEDVTLTVDLELQRYAAERLGEESAGVVVMDMDTGGVLALVSTPSYNPNDFNLGISPENWQALVKDPRTPLVNKAIAGQYPPGSTIKMLVILAALEDGLVDPDETVYCNGKHRFGDRTFHCWEERGHGRVDLLDSIAKSCDVYFYELAPKVGIDRIAAMARRFGLGGGFGLPLSSEAAGLVPSRDWKMGAIGERWHPGETLVTAIGQGYMLATPLQLAVMTARLANGGRRVKPRLIRSIGGVELPLEPAEPLGIDAEQLALVARGMEMVLEEDGTAYLSRLRGEGFSMAGKTGTSQVRRISKAEREAGVVKNEDKPWQERDHALFVAYGPQPSPRYALSVVVEHGGGGAKYAAPIARDIMRRTLEIDPAGTREIAATDPRETG